MSILLSHFALLALLCLTCFEVWSELPGNVTAQSGNTVPIEGWNLVNDSDDIYVYTHSNHNSDIHEVLVTTKILAPPWRVNTVLADYQHHPDFMPYVSETVVLREKSAKVSVFQQLDFFPLPVTDRYYTIRIVTVPDRFGAGSYRIGWRVENEKSFVREGRGIPIHVNVGSWELRPINNGAYTSVNYYHLADPGGWLPTWMINKAIIKVVPMMIKAVKQRVSASQYEKFLPRKQK
ncbi:MAG: SRPBCC family protein [Nitrosomonadaceae bacterium]